MEPTDLRRNQPQEQPPKLDVRQMIERFEQHFPMEMAVLRIGGVYPGEQAPQMINPYTHEADPEYFGNIGEHCMAVALCANALTRSFLGDQHPDKERIISRALVHDAGKRFEIMRKKALRIGAIEDVYSTQAYETIKPLLAAEDIKVEVIDYMAKAGQETGHTSMASFVELRGGQPVLKTEQLADMIVHLADDMTHTPIVAAGESAAPTFVTVTERMALSDFPNRYPFLYKEGFGFSAAGETVLVSDITQAPSELIQVRSYAEWQVWVADAICQHLLMLTQQSSDDPSTTVKNIVNETLFKRNDMERPEVGNALENRLEKMTFTVKRLYSLVSAIHGLGFSKAWFDLQKSPSMARQDYNDNVRKAPIRLGLFLDNLEKKVTVVDESTVKAFNQLYRSEVYPKVVGWLFYATSATEKLAGTPFAQFNHSVAELQATLSELNAQTSQGEIFSGNAQNLIPYYDRLMAAIKLVDSTILAYERTQKIAEDGIVAGEYNPGESSQENTSEIQILSADITQDKNNIFCAYTFRGIRDKLAIYKALMFKQSPLYQALVSKGWIDGAGIVRHPLDLHEANLYLDENGWHITIHVSRKADIIPFPEK